MPGCATGLSGLNFLLPLVPQSWMKLLVDDAFASRLGLIWLGLTLWIGTKACFVDAASTVFSCAEAPYVIVRMAPAATKPAPIAGHHRLWRRLFRCCNLLTSFLRMPV